MRKFASLGLALSLLAAALPVAATELRGTHVSLGTHFFYTVQHEQIAWGFSAAVVFHPEAMAPLSRRIADHNLGLALRYHRAHHLTNARVEGIDIVLRRYLGAGEGRWHPFLGGGIGQHGVLWDEDDTQRSTWSAVLEGGFELDLGSRFVFGLDLLARSLEFADDSFSGAAVVAQIGARIDP